MKLEKFCEVDGAALEFKRSVVQVKRGSKEIAQSCANLVKVGGYLTDRALSKGYLVEEINVYGLLISYGNPICIPLRYCAKVNDEALCMVGDEALFKEALTSLLAQL